MQTYEVTTDETLENLVRNLSRAVRKDKDTILLIPAGVNPFRDSPETIGKIYGLMRNYDARLKVQTADPALAEQFRAVGLTAGPIEAAAAPAPAPAAPATRPIPVPSGPNPVAAPPTAMPVASGPTPFAQAGSYNPDLGAPLVGGVPDELAGMNFSFDEVGVTPRPAAPLAAPADTAEGNATFLSKLRNRMAQPGAPVPPSLAGAGAAPPASAAPPAAAPAESFDFSGFGLDATLPPGITDTDQPAAGNRVVGRMPASNLDVTLPSTAGGAAGSDPFGTDSALPDWLTGGATGGPAPGPMADPFGAEAPLPDWLSAGGAAAPAVGADPFGAEAPLPDWLAGGSPAAPAESAGPFGADGSLPDWLTSGAPGPAPALGGGDTPDWLRGYEQPAAPGGPAMQSAAQAPQVGPGAPAGAAPAFAPAAPAPAAAPAAAPAGGLFAGLGGPPQTAESIGQAVSAAGLDARTRALLLFGMALVRLAGGEANGAALAARQAGCSTAELELVVEMAQALGGGPSERLGRKILGPNA
jgi:hypothetical protein